MSKANTLYASFQKLGKALMLPVSVLPIAGILLGVGAADFSFMPEVISSIMKEAGGAVFGQMALLFAVGVALGFTNNDGVAALAAIVGYGIMAATLELMVQIDIDSMIAAGQALSEADIKVIKDTYNTGVAGGILSGAIAAFMFNKYFKIQLPSYLGFFAGKRFVPIATGFGAIFLGLILSVVWPPIGAKIAMFSEWSAVQNPELAFAIYGFVERGLIPFGLHHVWNVPFFYEAGSCVSMSGEAVRGVLNCYLQADDASRVTGNGFGQLAGGYLFKMFGLPAAAIAIWHCAKPENKVKTGGIMISAALASFLTGITEPIEFAFMFVAPILYLVHMFLASGAYFITNSLEIVHGTTFSHGLIDFAVLSANSQKIGTLAVVGLMYAAVYYVAFRFVITKFNLKTPGRADEDASVEQIDTSGLDTAKEIILAYGGQENIVTLDSCITRLRIEVADVPTVDQNRLKQLGASGVIVMGNGVQAIMGTTAETLRTEMEAVIAAGEGHKPAGSSAPAPRPNAHASAASVPSTADTDVVVSEASSRDATQLLELLGGAGNVKSASVCAGNRVRVELTQSENNLASLAQQFGIQKIATINSNTYHLLLNKPAAELAKALAVKLS
jgi:PTS system glucose-specific IIC component